LKNLSINIAVFGEVNSGKGSLLNTLFGCNNDDPSTCFFKLDDRPSNWSDEAELSNGKVWSNHGDLIVKIYDTPSIAGDIENYLDISMKITGKADIILYIVHESAKSKLQVPYMKKILDSKKPLIVVINKIDVLKSGQIAAIREDLLRNLTYVLNK
jgi:tRNA U34 5-carboxymethylaminomethyl modifying GTPase MnmE/TrmE